ncbi:MAG: tRNA (adenosine(37)-N6)-threonylcarbamoyltransferase complex ATPase subunit type 1 TsaE [Cellvibrionales bacterium]|nr:tRNA (adenosine(37)-N6)-threonylcarbamoyltransferase complex ATPase subunit type 1 TsaE [Cellvibrionales bacterium]
MNARPHPSPQSESTTPNPTANSSADPPPNPSPARLATNYDLPDEQATLDLGTDLAAELPTRLPTGGIVFLQGTLGAGKTTLARGILRGLGWRGPVRSPTYTLAERYPTKPWPCCHFDLYRLAAAEELEFIGARDDLGGGTLCLIEWPERAAGWLKTPDLEVHLRPTPAGRHLELVWHPATA